MDETIRVIALIDMDAFYTQVEEREQPHLRGRPLAVVPFSRGTTITGQAIAVNYPARAFGIKRGMDCNEVNFNTNKKKNHFPINLLITFYLFFSMRHLCPIIHLCRVPAIEGVEKGDISKYRDASGEIFKVLVDFSDQIVVEKASVDEAFLDLTAHCEMELNSQPMEELVQKLNDDIAQLFPNTFLVNESDKQHTVIMEERLNSLKEWLSNDCRVSRQQLAIAIGATVVERIRKRVKEVTQFRCSAGISHNKILAKLVCARHKPNCQSVIVPKHIPKLYEQTPINSVWNLGGKFGKRLKRQFNAEMMAELRGIPRDVLLQYFHPKNVDWLTRLLEGHNDELVCSNLQPKSLGTSKQFAGASMLATVAEVKKWVHALSNELSKRLVADDDKYGRIAQTLVVGFSAGVSEHNVRTMHLPNYTTADIQQACWNFMRPFNREKDGHSWYPHVSCIYMSASRFELVDRRLPSRRITEFFHKKALPKQHNGGGGDECDGQQQCSGNGDDADDDIVFLAEMNLRKECGDDVSGTDQRREDDNVEQQQEEEAACSNNVAQQPANDGTDGYDEIVFLGQQQDERHNGRRRRRRQSLTRLITDFYRPRQQRMRTMMMMAKPLCVQPETIPSIPLLMRLLVLLGHLFASGIGAKICAAKLLVDNMRWQRSNASCTPTTNERHPFVAPPCPCACGPARPFVCQLRRGNELCRAPFGTEHALQTHEGIVHTADERGSPFRCPVPGCLFGTNSQKNCDRHVRTKHGGNFSPLICLPGEALCMSAVQEGQLFVGSTFVMEAQVSRRTKNVGRLTLLSTFDEEATQSKMPTSRPSGFSEPKSRRTRFLTMISVPGCLFGSNTERNIERHVQGVHGGYSPPVICLPGEALVMSAVEEGQHFVGDTIVMQARVQRRTKNVDRLTLVGRYDEYATKDKFCWEHICDGGTNVTPQPSLCEPGRATGAKWAPVDWPPLQHFCRWREACHIGPKLAGVLSAGFQHAILPEVNRRDVLRLQLHEEGMPLPEIYYVENCHQLWDLIFIG
ncbi:hypothetical protein niasHT_006025 [Heterodera trifolii]|uniref:DNA polymerase eta n=1 Tax=Heterodera trifolii TaxID=157864 RepID=A0ABD2M8E9_9BILA